MFLTDPSAPFASIIHKDTQCKFIKGFFFTRITLIYSIDFDYCGSNTQSWIGKYVNGVRAICALHFMHNITRTGVLCNRLASENH